MLINALDAALESLPEKEISADVVAERPIPFESRRADALCNQAKRAREQQEVSAETSEA